MSSRPLRGCSPHPGKPPRATEKGAIAIAIVIHHNPDCGTSRNVLAMIEAPGATPTVIEYLKTGWTEPQLPALFAAADLTPRTTKSPAEELGLLDESVDDATLLAAMLEHPVLVNGPSSARPGACACVGRARRCSIFSIRSRPARYSGKTAR